jgi:uncharacterized lipoprotein YmbA
VKHSPPARFFVLRAVVEPAASVTSGVEPGIVGILPAALPEHLVRSQMVTWTSDNEVRVEEFSRWAEPLDAGVTRVIRENLVALLPQTHFVEFPWRSQDALRCRVQVDMRFFGLQADGTVLLEGRWALLPAENDEPLRLAPVRLQGQPVKRNDPEGMVESMSELLAQLCRGIAEGIRTLPAEGSGVGRP